MVKDRSVVDVRLCFVVAAVQVRLCAHSRNGLVKGVLSKVRTTGFLGRGKGVKINVVFFGVEGCNGNSGEIFDANLNTWINVNIYQPKNLYQLRNEWVRNASKQLFDKKYLQQ